MPGTMFQEVVSSHGRANRAWYVLPLSFVIHGAVIGIVIVVPLMATDVLPAPRTMLQYMTVKVPDVPPPAPPGPVHAQRSDVRNVATTAVPLETPAGIGPETALDIRQQEAVAGTTDTITGLGLSGTTVDALPPSPAAVQPIRAGGALKAPTKIKDVMPVYPEIAKSARVHGIVILEAVIGVDGKVKQARVLRSVPLLDEAAVNAVQSWEYTPTLLNGQPVPIIMTVTVQFRLE